MKSKDLQAYQLWQSSAHGTWIHSTPSQIQPPQPTVQVVHIFLCPCLRWWCQPHGPHNAKNQEGDGHPHPRLLSLGVGPQATGSLLLLPVYWGSPYSAMKGKEQMKALNREGLYHKQLWNPLTFIEMTKNTLTFFKISSSVFHRIKKVLQV